MTPWEYLILPVDAPESVTVLNDHGKLGWEAVGLTDRPGVNSAVLMKRPLPQTRVSGGRM